MDIELSYAHGQTSSDDYMEGMLSSRLIMMLPDDIMISQSRIAASRNTSDEDAVDESSLNAGLFTYPVLQAADIMIYKYARVHRCI